MSIKLNKNLLDYLQNLHYINFREGKLVLNITLLSFYINSYYNYLNNKFLVSSYIFSYQNSY